MKYAMAFLLACVAFLHSAKSEAPYPSYRTPEELLIAVNKKMKENNLSPYTIDGLAVWVAEQAANGSTSGELQPRIESFLKNLREKEKFDSPIQLVEEYSDGVVTSRDTNPYKIFKLPPHSVLILQILNDPWGSVDKDGKNLKITWESIVIATYPFKKPET